MKHPHLTKIQVRLEQVQGHLAQHGTLSGSNYNVDRLVNTDVPELIQAVREAKREVEEAQRQLRLSREATTRFAVTVYSDSPMRVSRVEAAGDDTGMP